MIAKYLQASLMCDFYKLAHRMMYPSKTEKVYSTWTPRTSRTECKEVVAAGFQPFLYDLTDFFKENFFDEDWSYIRERYKRFVRHTLGVQHPETKHLEDLHELGYLPIAVHALPEGTVVPVRTPVMTIQNTDERFFWLTNYIETLASCELWQIATSATTANQYRKLFEQYAMKTVGNISFVPFQGHDFSMRGMGGVLAAAKSGLGHLFSFAGTDTCPSIDAAEHYYLANIEKELVGTSVNASEHSIQCSYDTDEEYLERLLFEVHPTGIVSIVVDGRDYWNVVTNILPKLKDRIMQREGKLVIRPDSGDPIKIICGDPEGYSTAERRGSVEMLYEIFGGKINELGYKELDSHIGLIYGDAITFERAREILTRLEAKQFASTNVVFGIGSFTYQYVTRDTYGFAQKSTLVVIDGNEKHISKDPKTDDGTKKSQRGRVAVFRNYDTPERYVWQDGFSLNGLIPGNLLIEIYRDGRFVGKRQTLSEIRARLREHG